MAAGRRHSRRRCRSNKLLAGATVLELVEAERRLRLMRRREKTNLLLLLSLLIVGRLGRPKLLLLLLRAKSARDGAVSRVCHVSVGIVLLLDHSVCARVSRSTRWWGHG